MTPSPDNLGMTPADELLKQSERDASVTPMDAVMDAARGGTFTDDHCFRLLARLWTLKRTMYYVYGGWAQGINLNEYPPAVAYLFGKQTYDESTHEMQLCDEMLRRRRPRAPPVAQPIGRRNDAFHGRQISDRRLRADPEDQKPIEEVFDFLLRPWASEPSRALGGSQ